MAAVNRHLMGRTRRIRVSHRKEVLGKMRPEIRVQRFRMTNNPNPKMTVVMKLLPVVTFLRNNRIPKREKIVSAMNLKAMIRRRISTTRKKALIERNLMKPMTPKAMTPNLHRPTR